MKILLVYELVPETTKFYTLEVSDADWEWMKTTHGHCLNCEMPDDIADACIKLSEYLEPLKPMELEGPITLLGKGFDYMLHTGFLL